MYKSYLKLGLRLSELLLAESRMQFGFDVNEVRVVVTRQQHRPQVPAWGSRRCSGPTGGWSHVGERLRGVIGGRQEVTCPARWPCLGFPGGVRCQWGQQTLLQECSL